MCQACRGLIEGSVRTCPLCGRDSVPALRVSDVGQSVSPHFISRLVFSINIVLYLLMALVELKTGKQGGQAIFESASGVVLADFGSCVPQLFFHGEWWRVVTPNFIHLGLIHLLVNSVVLYMLGPQVEEIYGSQKFIVIYLGTGIFSMLVSCFFGIGGGGASGSLSGLIGLLAAYGYRIGGPFGRALMRQMLFWAVIGLLPVSMFGGRVNWIAHGAGSIAGGALGLLIPSAESVTARANRWWNISAIGSAALIMAGFVMVAVNYGRFQHAGDMDVVWNAASGAEDALRSSIDWTPKSGRPANQVAAQLRVAISGLEKVPSIDERGDEIKQRWLDLLKRRSEAFGRVASDPAAPVTSAPADAQELKLLIDEFKDWFDEKTGVQRPRRRRGPIS